jgi:hypothetical protein
MFHDFSHILLKNVFISQWKHLFRYFVRFLTKFLGGLQPLWMSLPALTSPWCIQSMPSHPTFLKYISVSSYLCPGLPKKSLSFRCPIKILHTHTYFLPHTHHTLSSSHSHWFHDSDIGKEYTACMYSLSSFLHPLFTSTLSGPNILLSTLFLKYFQPMFSF